MRNTLVINYKRIIICLFTGIIGISVFAQIQIVPAHPSHSTPSIPQYDGNMNTPKSPVPQQARSYNSIANAGLEMYERDRMMRERQIAMQEEVDEDIRLFRERQIVGELIQNGFPSKSGVPGTDIFYSAYKELSDMLDGSIPMDIGRALYLTENAYLGNTLDYADFENEINERVQLCQWRMKEMKLKSKDNLALNMVIWSLLCDTLEIKVPGGEGMITHYPLEYNYDDYQSQIDFTSHFVSTLMKTNKGQCHSMPLLYLILAEKLGAEAYLSYAPMHSFIKIKDKKGRWNNLELTCKAILSDYHYVNHNYIKSEAIRNELYMNPLSKEEVVAAMMAQLGAYYYANYGFDPFLIECADKALEYYPQNTQGLILKAAYQERLFLAIARLLQPPSPEILQEMSPEAYKHYERMLENYQILDDTGYEETPVEVYNSWVEHINVLKIESGNNRYLK